MPTPYKVYSTRPLPADAVIVQQEGKPHVRLKDDRGRPVYYRLTESGTGYLRPSKRWYFDVPGKPGRVKGYADLKATEQLALDMARNAEQLDSGYADATAEHVRRPLAE